MLHVIYVPGISDLSHRQNRAVALWRIYGVAPHALALNWSDGEEWELKFGRLLNRIDELGREGHQVALVGVSAGASAVLNAFAARQHQVSGVVCISGKIGHPEGIRPHYRQNNPAFVKSAEECQNSLKKLGVSERKRILSRRGLIDGIVRPEDSKIAGAHNQRAPTIGHALSIAFQITFGAPSFIRFLKRQAKSK